MDGNHPLNLFISQTYVLCWREDGINCLGFFRNSLKCQEHFFSCDSVVPRFVLLCMCIIQRYLLKLVISISKQCFNLYFKKYKSTLNAKHELIHYNQEKNIQTNMTAGSLRFSITLESHFSFSNVTTSVCFLMLNSKLSTTYS